MNTILMIVLGICTGWIVTLLADYLPRFAATPQPIDPDQTLLHHPAWGAVILRNKQGMAQDDFLLNLAVETLGGIVFGVLISIYGLDWQTLLLSGGFTFFLLIALIDIKYRLILNILTYPAIVVAILLQLLFAPSLSLNTLLGGLLAFGVFYLTAWLRPEDLGSGDVKLAALLGLIFGFPKILWVLLIGTGTGAIILLVLSWKHQEQGKLYIPYAPFLCLGAMIALVFNPLQFI